MMTNKWRRWRRNAAPQASAPAKSDEARSATYAIASTVMGSLVVRTDDKWIGGGLLASGDFASEELTQTIDYLRSVGSLPDGPLDCFVDIGANIGTHTLHALQNLGFARAIAAEPDSENLRLLTANLALNGFTDRVTVARAAASASEGVAELRLSPDNRGDHRIVRGEGSNTHGESEWPTEQVPLRPFDAIVEGAHIDWRSSLVWIDTQGHETEVFRGMRATLASRPTIAFEFWPYGMSEASAPLGDLLALLGGYRFYDLQDAGLSIVTPDALSDMYDDFLSRETAEGSPHTMLLALPDAEPEA